MHKMSSMRSGSAGWAGAASATPAEGLASAPRLRLGAGAWIAAAVLPARALLVVHGRLSPCSRYAATSCAPGARGRAPAPVVAHHAASSHIRHFSVSACLALPSSPFFVLKSLRRTDLGSQRGKARLHLSHNLGAYSFNLPSSI